MDDSSSNVQTGFAQEQKARRTDSFHLDIVDGKVSGEYRTTQNGLDCELFLPGVCSDSGLAQVAELGKRITEIDVMVRLDGSIYQPCLNRWSNIETLETGARQIAESEKRFQQQKALQELQAQIKPQIDQLIQKKREADKQIRSRVLVSRVLLEQMVQLCQNRLEIQLENRIEEQKRQEEAFLAQQEQAAQSRQTGETKTDAGKPEPVPTVNNQTNVPVAKNQPSEPQTDYYRDSHSETANSTNHQNPLR